MMKQQYYKFKYKLKDICYKTECFFFPRHQRIRKAIPYIWADSDRIMISVNFAIITEFVEEELGGVNKIRKLIKFNKEQTVFTDCAEAWADFYEWLIEAYLYITQKRPKLERQMQNSFPKLTNTDVKDLGVSTTKSEYKKKYGKVDKLEKLINDTDTKYLTQMIEKREFFWT